MTSERHQVNLKLTPGQEEIVRTLVKKLREGGPSYERLVRQFLLGRYEPRYMHVEELNARFGALEGRIVGLEHYIAALEEALAAAGFVRAPSSEPGKESTSQPPDET